MRCPECAAWRRTPRSTRCRCCRFRLDARTKTTCLALLRETGILCVYGSGFGMPPEAGSFRIVYLARPGRTPVDLRRYRRIHAAVSAAGVSASPSSPRALIRYALVGLAVTVVHLLGHLGSPECAAAHLHQRAHRHRSFAACQRASNENACCGSVCPRWAAILVIYLCIIAVLVAIAAMVIPAVVRQARDLATELPRLLHQGQQWLIDRGMLTREISAREAVQQTATSCGAGHIGSGGECRVGSRRRRLRPHHDAGARLLPDGRQQLARPGVCPVVPTRQARAGRATRAAG